ncbi:MAG TPA: choice-of-anchor A family protein [Myxococcaceae bacterium]|nr:choice-of-anchor A family protein [Myxococcaceae bacterium]
MQCSSSEPGPEPAPGAADLRTSVQEVSAPSCSTCLDIHLGDYNVFLLEDFTYTGNIQGKLAAGGNITLSGFSVGVGLPASNVSNTLVAGGNLTLTNGAVAGAAWYQGSYTPTNVGFSRGTATQGSPPDFAGFAARFAELESLSTRLATQPVTGNTQHTAWSVTMTGTHPCLNVFTLNASDFAGRGDWTITAPAGSFVLVNVFGQAPTYRGGNIQLSGISPQRVLFNFVDATTLIAESFKFQGTLLAPKARATVRYTGFTGGLYAKALTLQFAPANMSALDELAGPQAEACNAEDDNCNGQVDEGFECTGSGSRSCTAWCGAEGTQRCDAATCGYEVCTSASCCRADADCAAGSYCESSLCTPQLGNGASCTTSNQCATGQCVDGVCCDTACDGECDACNLTGNLGTCSPAPSTVQCRGAGGECDVAEFCTGSSAQCPADAKKPATTECRGPAGVCDVAERCTGSSNDCPADGYASNTTQCRALGGECDVVEFCTGGGSDCPADGYASNTTLCRASAGECDVEESCTGAGASCPVDGFQSAGTQCTGDTNVCTFDVCNGAGSCGHPTMPAETSCDTSHGAWGSCGGFSDYCDTTGTQSRTVTASTCGTGTCSPSSTSTETQECTRMAPDTTCAAPVYGEWGACSYGDTCAQLGTQTRTVIRSAYSCATGLCVESTSTETQDCTRNTDGVLCRPAGVCDLAERCAGGSCPADGKMPAGDTCDDNNAGTTGDRCDGAGVCTGCGDGARNGSETCDDGNLVTETSCPYGQASCIRCDATCSQVLNLTGTYCGDNRRNGPEACDDGNTVTETSCPYGQTSCTACNATCTQVVVPTPSYCGDNRRSGPEACDDGNTVTETSCPYGQTSCTACNATCTQVVAPTPYYCGDWVRNGPEVCDDGNTVNETSCPYGTASCTTCNASCSGLLYLTGEVPPRNCSGTTVTWSEWQPAWNGNPRTQGTYTCSSTVSWTSDGDYDDVAPSSSARTGSARFWCDNGTWRLEQGTATCDGNRVSTSDSSASRKATKCIGSTNTENMFIGFYVSELKRCADLPGLAWWSDQYDRRQDCQFREGFYWHGSIRFAYPDNCWRHTFREGATNAGELPRVPYTDHVTPTMERALCGSLAYPYTNVAAWGDTCKFLPN